MMTYLSTMLVVLGIGVFSFMLGILINKEPEQSFQSAVKESVVWGIGFFVFFGSEFMLLGSV